MDSGWRRVRARARALLGMRWRRHGRLCALALLLALYAGALLLLLALPALDPASGVSVGGGGGGAGSMAAGAGPAGGGAAAVAGTGVVVAVGPRPSLRHPRVLWCYPLRFLDTPRPPAALASFPGSGNTWLRYLLQQATGVYTGSVYRDNGLLKNGFPAEGVANGSVSVVKTHEWGPAARRPFARALLLVRAPDAAILAEFNRQSGGHVGHAVPERYARNGGKYWQQFVRDKLATWRATNLDWALNFTGPVLVLHYEELVRDPGTGLRRALRFLGLPPRDGDALRCALDRKEGIYRRRRRHAPFDPYTAAMKEALARERDAVMDILRRFRPPPPGLEEDEHDAAS